ncbi:hypothetical protein M427DRAFT_48052 [Gonapodya prolifera JEL478]|uniref:SF3 helicase domain-containing protein n=1 Tax=Gonapodya prolifera (strain JEL478) TaxID=1344416 RepID=A0A139A0Y5_GONPJ|nr:hypothetical protein M427DRAFT_48052 [Gonapodya prolifera JEL478]|eukprot:KXS10440.1 hypothetical protein M427DRAFT_48052 [Gonapodya prolifera JEL478]
MLHEGTHEEIFTIFNGRTRNGKSVLADLVKETLGEYCVMVDSKMATGDRPPLGSPQPDLMELIGKRAVFISEPQKSGANQSSLKLNSAFIKLITGNDTIAARALYSNEITHFKTQAKITIIWMQTTKRFGPTGPKKKLINKRLKDKLPLWKLELVKVLINYWKIYEIKGLCPTPQVVAKNKKFWDECVKRTSSKHLHFSSITKAYNAWLKQAGYNFNTYLQSLRSRLEQMDVRIGRVREVENANVQQGVNNHKLSEAGLAVLDN